ncbi:anaerobic ribonucleoside-triphosphate reductase activating protein [Paenibacillus alvei]|uniref:anaerobic ribonucleoside-triphosphate reductase activating protein n=1 Tax=Paenibacillus alvei TaxID=44250 RepID=UPI000287B58C|nr:anaerobic ribonucleoside-triphosphate reductase activating protein [Paenibacillus alvei]EJW13906.1 anaerobic ribonucleoside-triphosphate reductase-activating protein [Paenibacillus alvei DSM 29]MCY9545122.1 anaerobic ribonucleoside-triphosphate reductase activating protein [Paenibacillus alvei]MCY9707729.1 anaerobic ribonucleoside-triphosphate reductase activating protein [Paenibacillus alvei]MCY9757710.1 anaerobic ribonucleoside-triphosphate reductase activating protein [Paenibacillus alvei
MKVMNIIHDSIVDGDGLRAVIFFAGCPHRCPGCHNPQSWNMMNGTEMSVDEIFNNVMSNPMSNVTFSGGDPFMQSSRELAELARKIKDAEKSIWCFTGYSFDQVCDLEVIKYIDVLVDGKFEIDKRDLDLAYKGSSNQRIIDVQRSLIEDKIIIWG